MYRSTRSACSWTERAEPPVIATANVDRCHVSCPSTSLTETPSLVLSWAFAEARSLRLDFRDPESGKCRWMSRSATYALSAGEPIAYASSRSTWRVS
jgi:hypothetical protein